jgi:glycogen debranching enzyme
MTDPRAARPDGADRGLGGLVTLVEETSFCLSDRAGDIAGDGPQGLFHLDTRLLSGLVLRVNGVPPEPLSVAVTAPFAATFVGRSRLPGSQADGELLVLRRRYVGRGLREDIEVRNYGPRPVTAAVRVDLRADLADLSAVKDSRVGRAGDLTGHVEAGTVEFRHRRGGVTRQVRIRTGAAASVNGHGAGWTVTIPAGGSWSTCVQVSARLGDLEVAPRHRCGQPAGDSEPVRRLRRWRREVPRVNTDWVPLRIAYDRALTDVGALRLFDPARPDRPVVAAGAPWFMTVFGRDCLLTGYQALLASPDLALGALHLLARLQGVRTDPDTEEQPGRILHEVRFGSSPSADLAAGQVYYGTADASPLFVLLLGECLRWGVPYPDLEPLVPAADRALAWVETDGDPDADGFVEYQRLTPAGLLNQGWKDDWDSIPFADGRLAEPPIALCEVQGYVYAGYLARAALARAGGDPVTAGRCEERAAALRRRFNEVFWLPERGYYALALDGAKRPVDALASNMGHCLWTGIAEADKARAVADRLLSPELFSGWGIRTLATSMASYHPVSYHRGSVWPHDNALCAAGLMRYGFVEEAHRVIGGMLAAAAAQGGRLPELFSGLDRDEVATPVGYPTSCSPQAWAAAAPLQFLRTVLRLEPDVPAGRVGLTPVLPPGVERLRVGGVRVGDARLDIHVEPGRLDLGGLPGGVELVPAPPAEPG